MQLNLIVDRVVKGKIYPALARFQAEPFTPGWRQFNQHWPHTVPLRLQEYFETHGPGIAVFDMQDSVPAMTFYAIGLSWFDFGIDYFDLVPRIISERVKQGEVRILFFYHEGDNPFHIKQRLDTLAESHSLPTRSYLFVSSNSASDSLSSFVSFQDSELWFWHRNREVPPCVAHTDLRQKNWTVLNRLHKWWRAAIMTDLKRYGILDQSYWSYCETDTNQDSIDQCPIALDCVDDLRTLTHAFVQRAPYFVDDLTQDQRNDHSLTLDYLHNDSYCNIVLETLLDYDQSGGVLLSEKTFKPIKHGQMFFVAGAAGSLRLLRELGYRTFDHVLDNSYDAITDNTDRWISLRSSIVETANSDMKKLYEAAHDDILHNQQFFLQSKYDRLSNLLRKIHDKSS